MLIFESTRKSIFMKQLLCLFSCSCILSLLKLQPPHVRALLLFRVLGQLLPKIVAFFLISGQVQQLSSVEPHRYGLKVILYYLEERSQLQPIWTVKWKSTYLFSVRTISMCVPFRYKNEKMQFIVSGISQCTINIR